MDTSNIIAIALGGTSFIISIIGLVVTPLINLKSKRLEKRLENRFVLFKAILKLWEYTHNNMSFENDTPLLSEVNKLIQLYGYNIEIKLFKEVIDSYNLFVGEQSNTNKQELVSKFNNFFEKSFNTYRRELVLEKLD